MKKKIQRIILSLVLIISFIFSSSQVQAQNININNLTQEQRSELIKILKAKILEITKRIEFLIEKKYNNSLVYKLIERPLRGNKERFPIKVDTSYDYVDGNPDAKLILVMYSDLECPFCKVAENTVVKKLKAKYNRDDLSYVVRHFPLKNLHASACTEARASVCAGSLGGSDKYYQMIEEILKSTKTDGKFDLKKLPIIAKEIGVNKGMFNKCLDDEKIKTLVKKSYDEGVNAGVMGTPTMYLMAKDGDGVRVTVQYSTLDKIVTDVLNDWDKK